MKKRRPRAKNTTRSPIQFSKLQQDSVVPSRSKSFQELKRRLTTGNVQQNRKCRTQEEKILSLNKNAFDSLESLFDVKKALHFLDIKSYIDYDHDEISTEASSAKSSDHCVTNRFPYSLSHPLNPKSNILPGHHESVEFDFIRRVNHSENLSLHSLQRNAHYFRMADTNKIIDGQTIHDGKIDQENISAPTTVPETEEEEDDEQEDVETSEEEDDEESGVEKVRENEEEDEREDGGDVGKEDEREDTRVDVEDDSEKDEEENEGEDTRVDIEDDSEKDEEENEGENTTIDVDDDSVKYDDENEGEDTRVDVDDDSVKYDDENEGEDTRVDVDDDSIKYDDENDGEVTRVDVDDDSVKYDDENEGEATRVDVDDDNVKYDDDKEGEVTRVDVYDDSVKYDDENEGEDKRDDEVQDLDSIPEELAEITEEESPEDDVSELSVHLNPSDTHRKNVNRSFANTLIDSEVFKEMTEATDRCAAVEKEIDQLQQELRELQQKEDFSEDDKRTLEEKRKNLMEKMSELDSMTTKIQDTLGLLDPSNDMFIKAFETFIESPPLEMRDAARKAEEAKTKRMVSEWQAWEDQVPEEDRFDVPKQEYPEDRLPRVIVCGYTEDELPKIVVADSERRPRSSEIQCLENITGKLAESLDIQEKLAKENAQLEGGKYKLEEALIEKDDTVDTLQRKVCDLQAEMRMIVKENSELSHQLAALNQRLNNQLSDSPRSLHQPSPTTTRSIDKSCRCRHCMQKYHSNIVGVSPHENKDQESNSPRLGGGGSGETICCKFASSANQNLAICCRNPGAIPMSEQIESSVTRVICPAEMENKLACYETSTKQLEQQLGTVESEVRNMKVELANVQRERQQLDQQRKLLTCTGPCAPCPCTPPAPGQTSQPAIQLYKAPTPITLDSQGIKYQIASGSIPSCTGVCINAPMGASNCPLQQLRDLREQYARLQEDYKNKLTEVSCLRTDAEKMKQDTRDAKDAKERAENRLIDLEERLKIFDTDRNRFNGSKEQLMEQEQTLIVAKQRYRDAQEELEELRSLIQDQANQLEDYRNKYLLAQEQVEEQRRQIELMEMDNARMNENVTLEIGRVKNQFQEKLSELAPLPDILKQTQIKLQESQQMRLIAERNCEELTRELLNCKDRIGAMTSQSEILRTENAALKVSDLDNLEDRNREFRNENERLKNALARCEEREIEHQKRLDDKKHEIVQLSSMLEQVREDSARQVARTKERCETIRRRMQGEISEMEKQLVQCRATAKAAQKDRDEIRQKMQGQINHLSEAFNHAQSRVRNLQGHVNYLKPANSNVYCTGGPGDGYTKPITPEPHQNPYDPCDCSY